MGRLQTLVIPAGRFTAFLDEFPRTWRMVSETVVRRLDDADRRVRSHAGATGAERLALLLIRLAELSALPEVPEAPGDLHSPGRNGGEHGLEIRPPLSQEELAGWVDTSRETVARALKVWRARGLVRTERRKIIILDLPGLHDYAGDRGPSSRGRPSSVRA
jgi:CRP-like cAMP-binding protein